MGRARRAAEMPSRRGPALVLLFVLVVGAIGSGGWVFLSGRARSVNPAGTGLPSTTNKLGRGPSVPATSATPPAKAGVAACVAELHSADAVASAARTGIGHWSEHVQARTDLLSGQKPQIVTSAIWKRTRLAGPGDLARYDQAVGEYMGAAGACAATRSGGAQDRLAACKQRAQMMGRALAAAADGMADWRAHQQAMAAHKAGQFDATHAQHLWVAAWTAAPKNIEAFRVASAQLAGAPACR